MDLPWTIEQRTDGRYDLCYDGTIVGQIDKRSHAERLALAGNACRYASNDDLEAMDVHDLLCAISSFLTALGVRRARKIITGQEG
jgi:hypothetical protein